MLREARHDFNEVAGSVAIVELPLQNAVPGILASPWRAWQAKDVGAVGQTGTGARLNRRGADFLERDHVKDGREAFDILFEEGPHCFRRHVAASEARPAGRDDDVHLTIGDPGTDPLA